MTGDGWHDPIYAQDRAYSESQIPPLRLFKFVSPGYMSTMGGTLIAGRDITWADVYGLQPVAMVSENLARELWGHPRPPSANAYVPTPMASGAKWSGSSAICATTG